jgi:hypothetical protein
MARKRPPDRRKPPERKLSPDTIEPLAKFFADILLNVMDGMISADSVQPKFAKIQEAARKLTKQEMRRIAAVAGKYYAERANPSPKRLSKEQVENLKREALEFALRTNGK